MLYTEGRLQKVTLLRFELASILEVSQILISSSTSSVRFDAGAFKILLADICDVAPSRRGASRTLAWYWQLALAFQLAARCRSHELVSPATICLGN